MHELSIIEALVEQVEEELRQAGATGRAQKIELSVGRLSGANVESLRFAFDLLTPGTRLEGTELVFHQPVARCVCFACGGNSPLEEVAAECPACGSREIRIEGGRDLVLQSIEVDDP